MISLEAELNSFKKDFSRRKRGKSPITPNLYAGDIKILSPKQTYESCAELANCLVERVNRARKDNKYKPTTKNRIVSSLSSFLKFLKREGKIDEPTLNSFLPSLVYEKVKEEIPPTLSYFDFEKIMNVVPSNTYYGARDRALFYLMAHVGLRESEVINLTHSCLKEDKENFVITVHEKYKIRTLTLDTKTTEEVKNYLDIKKQKHRRSFKSEEPLFVNKQGNTNLCTRQPRRRFVEYTEEVGIKAALHYLRNTYIKALSDSGKSEKELAELLGIRKEYAKTLISLFSKN